MKTGFISLVAGVLAVGSVGGAMWWSTGGAASDARRQQAEEIEALKEKVVRLEESQARLRESMERLEPGLRPAASGEPSADRIEQAVARWLETNPRPSAAGEKPAGEGADPAAPGDEADEEAAPDLETLLAQVRSPRAAREEKERGWRKIRDAGLLDPAITALEERARQNPGDAGSQADLGLALLQKVTGSSSDAEKGVLAVKADKAFDTALAIDPNHWEARFTKATSLSFWPPIFGKQAEAIKHFETLCGQQEALATRPEFAQTYLFLGNMYLGQGSPEKAASTWKKGLAVFPDHAELSRRIADAEAK